MSFPIAPPPHPSVTPVIPRYGPRNATISPTGLAVRLSGWFTFAVAILIVCIVGIKDVSELTRLRTAGVMVTGKIVDRQAHHGKAPNYRLQYEFQSGGATVRDWEVVDWDTYYHGNEIGQPFLVSILPNHPEIHRAGGVDDQRVRSSQMAWGLGLGALVLLASTLLIVFEWEFAMQRRYVRDAVAETATVVDAQRQRSSSGKGSYWIAQFQYGSGGGGQGSARRYATSPGPLYKGAQVTALIPDGFDGPVRLLEALWMVRAVQ